MAPTSARNRRDRPPAWLARRRRRFGPAIPRSAARRAWLFGLFVAARPVLPASPAAARHAAPPPAGGSQHANRRPRRAGRGVGRLRRSRCANCKAATGLRMRLNSSQLARPLRHVSRPGGSGHSFSRIGGFVDDSGGDPAPARPGRVRHHDQQQHLRALATRVQGQPVVAPPAAPGGPAGRARLPHHVRGPGRTRPLHPRLAGDQLQRQLRGGNRRLRADVRLHQHGDPAPVRQRAARRVQPGPGDEQGPGAAACAPPGYPRLVPRHPSQWFSSWSYPDGCPPVPGLAAGAVHASPAPARSRSAGPTPASASATASTCRGRPTSRRPRRTATVPASPAWSPAATWPGWSQ